MEIIGAFIIGLASGTIGAISTGGGLISVPGVIFLGLSPVSAIATTRLSALSGAITSLYKYHKGKAIVARYLPFFVTIALLGGIIGPKLLLQINEDILERLIGLVLLAMLPVLMFVKGFGTDRKVRQKKHTIPGYFALFLVMIYGTMFGAGAGIFLVYTLIYFFGMTVTESNATGTAMWLFGTTAALIAYIINGVVVFSVGIPLLIGASIGGYSGAHLALKKGVAWVKIVLTIVIVLSSTKLIFF